MFLILWSWHVKCLLQRWLLGLQRWKLHPAHRAPHYLATGLRRLHSWSPYGICLKIHILREHFSMQCVSIWLYIVQGMANMQWKYLVSIANGRTNFFYCLHHFSCVKAPMNTPPICKLRKNCLTGIDQRVKMPQFLHFPININQVRYKFSRPIS